MWCVFIVEDMSIVVNVMLSLMTVMSPPLGSQRHSLQSGELSRRLKTAVQIVLKPLVPSNGGPIYRFLGKPSLQTGWMAGTAPHKSG